MGNGLRKPAEELTRAERIEAWAKADPPLSEDDIRALRALLTEPVTTRKTA